MLKKIESFDITHNHLGESVIEAYTIHHPQYGNMRIEIGYKKGEQHLPWVENIIHADSPITSFGTYSDTIHGGVLTGKPVDYETPEHSQSLPGSKQLNDRYADQRAAKEFQANPLLQFYKKHLQNLDYNNQENKASTFATTNTTNISSRKNTSETIDQEFEKIPSLNKDHNPNILTTQNTESNSLDLMDLEHQNTSSTRQSNFINTLLGNHIELSTLAKKYNFETNAQMIQYIHNYINGKNDGKRIPNEYGLRKKATEFMNIQTKYHSALELFQQTKTVKEIWEMLGELDKYEKFLYINRKVPLFNLFENYYQGSGNIRMTDFPEDNGIRSHILKVTEGIEPKNGNNFQTINKDMFIAGQEIMKDGSVENIKKILKNLDQKMTIHAQGSLSAIYQNYLDEKGDLKAIPDSKELRSIIEITENQRFIFK